MTKKLFLIAVIVFFQASSLAENFSQKDFALVKQAQDYLSSIKTMSANFTQTSPGQIEITSGEFYISKPGRILVRYLKPYQIDYFIRGDNLLQYDYDLDQIARGSAPNNPLKVLLYDDANLLDNPLMQLVAVKEEGGRFELLMVTKDKELQEDLAGLILKFNTSPISLSGISRITTEDIQMEMELFAVKENKELDQSMFEFVQPKQKYPNSPKRAN